MSLPTLDQTSRCTVAARTMLDCEGRGGLLQPSRVTRSQAVPQGTPRRYSTPCCHACPAAGGSRGPLGAACARGGRQRQHSNDL